MSTIKNDPRLHVKRSNVASLGRGCLAGKSVGLGRKNEMDFLTAPIDKALYIDLNPSSRQGSKLPRKPEP